MNKSSEFSKHCINAVKNAGVGRDTLIPQSNRLVFLMLKGRIRDVSAPQVANDRAKTGKNLFIYLIDTECLL